MLEPRYIRINSDGKYELIICDEIEGMGKGGSTIPGLKDWRAFSTLREASECMADMYEATYNQLMKEYKELVRQREEAVALLKRYFKEYGDIRLGDQK